MQIKIAGCLLSILVLFGLMFGMLFFVDSAIGHITSYKIVQVQTEGAIAIAKLDAQARITVGCEENSWFTSMKSCIQYSGVNGLGGFSWWTVAGVIIAAGLITWWRNRDA